MSTRTPRHDRDRFGSPNAFARDHAGHLGVRFVPRNGHEDRPGRGDHDLRVSRPARATGGRDAGLRRERPGVRPERGYLYVAETSRDEIYRIPYDDGSLGAIELFARGTAGGALDGADGIAFDVRGNLYVCSNQSDEIAVLSPDGVVIAEYRGTGANAFNSPASLVFKGRTVYVANLALFHGGPNKVSAFTAPYPGK